MYTVKINSGFGGSQDVCRFADIIAVLPFFNGNDAYRRVCKLVRGGEMRYSEHKNPHVIGTRKYKLNNVYTFTTRVNGSPVMLVVGQLHAVVQPDNGRRRIGFDVTFQVHVVLQSLSETWFRHAYDRSEFYLHRDITPGAATHAVFGHAIVSAAVFFRYARNFQNVSPGNITIFTIIIVTLVLGNRFRVSLPPVPVNRSARGQNRVVFTSPRNPRAGETAGVAFQFHWLPFVHDQRSGRVVGDDRRATHFQLHFGGYFVVQSEQHLAPIKTSVGLLNVLDLKKRNIFLSNKVFFFF